MRAEPDGYTIGIGGPNHYVVNQSVYPLTYDTLKDFEPISMLSNGPMIIMSRNSLPANNLTGLVAWFMHRTYHMSRIPSFNLKVRVVVDWTLALFLKREVVSLVAAVRASDGSVSTSPVLSVTLR